MCFDFIFGRLLLVLLPALAFAGAGCSATSAGHFYNPQGQALTEWDGLWEEVDTVFPGALPDQVKLVWGGGVHSSFLIESNSISIPSYFPSHIRRGKICRELVHLALHHLSGGTDKMPGRCFDNDVVFLEQAVAGYMDRKAAGLLEQEVPEASALAAEIFHEDGVTPESLRDWESFYYRGYWSDEFQKWNAKGLRALISLGDFVERRYGLARLGPVFEDLGDGETLERSVQDALGVELNALLGAWKDEVMASAAKAAPSEAAGDSEAATKEESPPGAMPPAEPGGPGADAGARATDGASPERG